MACPLVYNGHLSSTNLCPREITCPMGGGSGPPRWLTSGTEASRAMGTGLRSRSLRRPRPSYGKLQEGQLRRALSLRQGREKSRSQGLDGGPERLEAPAQERLPGSLGDTEQLIQAQRPGSRMKQYQQQVRRRWESFVASFPRVTLSRSASQTPPLDTTS